MEKGYPLFVNKMWIIMWIRWISVLFDKTLVLYYDKWSGFRPFLHFTHFHVVGYV